MAWLGLVGWELVVLSILFFVFLLSGVIAVWYMTNRVKWPFTVNLFENISGAGYIPTKKYRARLVAFGDGGLEVFYIKGLKKYRAAYGKRAGVNKLVFAESNGYWYNITFGDLDSALLKLGITPTNSDPRYSYSSIRKGFEKAFRTQSFAEKWGVPITIGMLIIAIIVFGIVVYFMFSKAIQVSVIGAQTAETLGEVAKTLDRILARTENINNGGSGLVPA